MGGTVLLIVFLSAVSYGIVSNLRRKYRYIDVRFLSILFLYHALLTGAYFVYVSFNPSDSKAYYNKVVSSFRGDTWFSFYGTSTTFIEFLGYPFIRFLGFSYESLMILFSFLGYLGFMYLYILFKERIRFSHLVLRIDLVPLIFFLPNLHFWSSSFGKGSVIFLGIGLFFFGISMPAKRWVAIVLGAVIVYHVRPHILLVILVSTSIGFLFSSKGVNLATRTILLAAAIAAFFFIYRDVLTLVGIDQEELITEGFDLTHRASELSKATSGVDINNYSLPMQVFTFLYRPLFFDAPGFLGIIVSIENVFYLLISLRLLSLRGLQFLVKGSFLVKSAFLSFLTVSIALAQISGNLGLAIRQKSQVMILFLFVILMFLDEEKYQRWVTMRKTKPPGLPRKPKIISAT